MANEWINAVKEIYQNSGNDGSVNKPIVTKMGKELMKPIDREFPIGVDYNSPDYAFRENLKRNVWNFAVAKNYNDCVRLSNLLLRPDGSLRPWNEFKKEAHFVVGTSNRYLKTEYDTIVAGAQMSRLWQEIQRDKHIFPFVQLKVVLDGHTSEICSPLHNLIFAVDDPVLEYYFPPNHFNCRTTAIKLRNGPANKDFTLPEIPEAFQNNVGATGQIFTEKNAYIENTPEEVLKIADKIADHFEKNEKLLKDENYHDVAFGENGGVKATHKNHEFDKKYGYTEKEIRDYLFKEGNAVILENEISPADGIKTPDGILNGKIFEIKAVIGKNGVIGNNNIKNKLTKSNSQGCECTILFFENENLFNNQLLENAITRFKNLHDNHLLKEVWIYIDGKMKKFKL